MTEVSIIAAIAHHSIIGGAGAMPWNIPEDLEHFKELTTSHAVIMGRKTWESLPNKPLPGRKNIVVTSTSSFQAPGAQLTASVPEAIALCTDREKVFIIGGEQIFLEGLLIADTLELTRIHKEVEGDVHFPKVKWQEWQLVKEEHKEQANITFQTYKKR